MPIDVYSNNITTTITSGGTTAPSAGTTETWTASSSVGFTAASSSAAPPTRFQVVDPAQPTELMTVTNMSGTGSNTWAVTRGVEGTTPVAHASGFTVRMVVTAGALNALRLHDTFVNAKQDYNAKGDGSTDDTTALQNALNDINTNGGGVLYLPAGTYVITSTLTIYSGTHIIGDGWLRTSIHQTTSASTQHGLYSYSTTAAPMTYAKIEDIMIVGPGQGTGTGHGCFFTGDGTQIDEFYLSMRNVFVKNWGSDGVYIDDGVVCDFISVTGKANGGSGFFLATGGTSCSFITCYAFSNSSSGFRLSNMFYSTFTGCAADNNTFYGYKIESGCKGIILDGCGAEANTSDAFRVDGSFGVGLNACYVNNPAGGACFHVLTNSSGVDITAPTIGGTAGSATNFIKIEAGSSATLSNIPATTHPNLYSGTVVFADAPGDIGGLTGWATGSLFETFPFAMNGSTGRAIGATTGTVYMVPVWLPCGMTITNLNWMVGATAATSPTHWWLGIADSTGKQQAHTADQTSTAIAANSLVTKALTSTFTTTYTGTWYVLLSVTATTNPTSCGLAAPVGTLPSGMVTAGVSASTQSAPGTDGTTTYTLPTAFGVVNYLFGT